ncbi:MAG: ABC transporter permease subunit [Candidatus Tectomicrobia bacterium]|nr:ABC transporter permease subunit [Candidatus Tectomicrobia bacterium]
MSNALAVYHKELRQYFRSPIAYFVVAVFLLGAGYFFTYNIFFTGIATMTETFQNMGILLLVVLPAVTMRLFAAEYSAGTMELLQTLPLSPWQVVLGKYLGAVTVLLLITAGTWIDLVPLYLYGNPDMTAILSGYIGFVLLGMACLAIGQFFSALTENQIVAALFTVSVLLGFWFVGHLQSFQSSHVWRRLFGYLSFSQHFGEFVLGLVRTEAVAFFLIVSAIALTLNANYLQWRR